jgi:hypothetical protein
VFRTGGVRAFAGKPTVSLQEVLNGDSRAEMIGADGKQDPVQISGWGYSDYDGHYSTSGRIGRAMKVFARKPYEELPEKRGGVAVYRMTKKTA